MKEWSRKLITMVLTLSRVLSMVPATVFATESTEAGDTVIEETVPEKIEVKDVTVAAKTWPEGEEKPADLTIRTANL